MSRYVIDEFEIREDDQIFDTDNRKSARRDADPPKRSPIRRKDKWRQDEGMKTKSKRNHKKIQNKIKYNWQGE